MNIDGETKLVGILGYPVSHSLSPRMQNAAFQEMGLNICYVPLPVKPEDLSMAVEGLKAMGFIGANVTIPHKVAVAALLEKLASSATRSGAVNTIVNEEGLLVGHNTDGAGFIRALEEVAPVVFSDAPVTIFGAGGAARSVAVALAEKGVPQISIVNRTKEKAEDIQALLASEFPAVEALAIGLDEHFEGLVASSKIVINATSLGMEGHLKTALVPVDKLSKDHIVCDLVYSKQETPLLIAAKEKGATFVGGLGMLLYQGAASIHLWTGMEPPVEVMRKALES